MLSGGGEVANGGDCGATGQSCAADGGVRKKEDGGLVELAKGGGGRHT